MGSPAVTAMINSVDSSTYDVNLQNQDEFEEESSTVLNES